MSLPGSLLPVLEAFRPEFSPRTWPRIVTLILGTILARGRRTVAAALRQMGLHEAPDFSSYHQVFNRAEWSARLVARRLLSAAIAAFVPEGVGLTFAIDETLERRWGKKIRIRGHYRDPLASSKERSVAASGIRWIVLALVVTVPCSSRPWALPILSLPSPTPEVSLKLGRRHKTIAERARQVIACLRRWLPMADLTVVGDSAYSVIELGLASRRRTVRLIAPLRLDARLFTPAPERVPGTVGGPASSATASPTSMSSWPTPRPPGPRSRCAGTTGPIVRSRSPAGQRSGTTTGSSRCRSAGSWCVTRPGTWSRGPPSRRGPRTRRRRSRRKWSSAGRSR